MRSHYWKLLQRFYNTPHRSSDRAYEASKQLQSIKKESLRTVAAFTNTEFNKSKFIIYWSLLECRLSIFILGMQKNLGFFLGTKFPQSLLIGRHSVHPHRTNKFMTENCLDTPPSHLPETSLFRALFLGSCQNYYRGKEKNEEQKRIDGFPEDESEHYCASAKKCICHKLSSIEKMNRKLAWIEAILNDSDSQGRRYSINPLSLQTNEESIEESFGCESIDFPGGTAAYESISLVPRSVTRTLSRFEAESTSQSSSLVLNDFGLAKNQALASLRYTGCLLLFPFTIPISLKNRFLEPWIRGWWNISQPQIFINSFQEERALRRLRKVEALLWLNDATRNSVDTQLWNYDTNAYNETIRSAVMYNEANIQLLLQLVTDVISIAILVFLLIMGRKRLAVSNSRIQELFYSLNDTMKAFSILPLTDLCVGFHSPHGWEIFIGSSFEHFGLAPNKYVISRFVSTFPVISDTVFKYRIFRHLNRTSPSIVATYHTMSE
uniref:Potassium/proton antiporter CemA n=1 Tax=Cibotium barometz TaxID=29588 RepID=A0A2S1PV58_CIBBA|nr:envelope membrane protein [Cibotium barometz]WHE38190.1 envelope membrane carbon uptake protein [Cibotium sinoburmaense]AWH62714.1 envelope membrane protein [Cibotium barometz]WHE37928.1 envelope membrane carbon uptake protein [Cibotium barometz]WHE38015.1 envelope membrane carbon uptake protein [Cibotium barometz]WHE38103.1 envelope membrane carbon uptake protein [Cibotium barometz]